MAPRTTRRRQARTTRAAGARPAATQDALFSVGPPTRAATPVLPPVFSDREYQIRGVARIVDGLLGGGRGQVRAACGTGKTKMAHWSAQRLVPTDGVVVIVAPTVGLVAQTLAVWSQAHQGHRALAVCSDTTINDDTFGTVADILEPVTTDPEVIDHWLRLRNPASVRLIVGTHKSAHVIGEGLQRAGIAADLLVIDEAHRTAGRADRHTALLHDDDVLPALRRLYMTATPRVFSNAASAYETPALSMDNPEVFGDVLFNYPFSEAIRDGWLDDYRVAVIGVTKAEVYATLQGLRDRASQGGPLPTEHTAMVQAVTARAAAQLGLRRVIAFCPRVNEAALFAGTFHRTLAALPEHLRPRLPLHAAHVSGKMSQATRDAELNRLAQPPGNGWTVLANARCLSEGIDVPAIDGVVFTAPKKSPTDIVQAVGRALRRDPNGTGVATIIVPILLPDERDASADAEQIDAQDFDVLWQVVQALRAHDDTFAAALDRHSASRGGTQQMLERFTFSFPEPFQDKEFLEHLTVRLVRSATSTWWVGYGHLADLHARQGHCRVPHNYIVDGLNLTNWTQHARTSYRQHRLAPDRVEALLKLGFDFATFDETWERALAAAQSYVRDHGHLQPPKGTIVDGVQLDRWLAKQRGNYQAGRLRTERAARLTALGMVWDVLQARWEANIAALRDFHAEHGNLDVPEDLTSGTGTNLFQALRNYRTQYRKGELPEERIAALDALGMRWDHHHTLGWNSVMRVVREHHAQHGDLDVPRDARDERGVNVRSWLHGLRQRRIDGYLTDAQIAELDALGMVWEIGSLRWLTTLTQLRAYRDRHGHIDIPPSSSNTEPGVRNLYAKLRNLRLAYRKGELPASRVADLEDLGIDWDPTPHRDRTLEQRWLEVFAAVQQFHTQYGHLNIPKGLTSANGTALHSWLQTQRRAHARGELSAARFSRLDALGMQWEQERGWQHAIGEARAYVREHGPLGLMRTDHRPVSGFNLYAWMSATRRAARNGEVPEDRLRVLQELGIFEQRPQPTNRRANRVARGSGEQAWQRNLSILQQFHAKHGDINHSRATDDDRAEKVAELAARFRGQRRTGRLAPERAAALEALGIDWDPAESHAEQFIAAARRFHATHGHLLPKPRYTDPVHGVDLPGWLARQRTAYRRGTLTDAHVRALDALGMVWDLRQAAWEEGLAAARVFHAEHGHLQVPNDYRGVDLRGEPYKLLMFIRKQRDERRDGLLSQACIAELDALGIDWEPHETRWRANLAALTAYHALHGNVDAPSGTMFDGVAIGDALTRYRALHSQGDLAADRVAALDALGMRWAKRADMTWEAVMAYVRGFYVQHGHINVPHDVHVDGVRVQAWIVKQRSRREKGRMAPAQIAALDAVGMAWGKGAYHEGLWWDSYAAAEEFHAEHGHLRVPYVEQDDHPETYVLYRWVNLQRSAYQKRTLPADRVAALDKLGIDWTPIPAHERLWQQIYRQVAEFRVRHGHFDFRSGEGDERLARKLAKWCGSQRAYFAQGELSAERVALLNEIGFDWRPVAEQEWEQALALLRDYTTQCGDPNAMPVRHTAPNGFGLYNWLTRAKRLAHDGTLTRKQTQQLVEHGVVLKPPRVRKARQ